MYKKFFAAVLATAALTSCTEDFTDWATRDQQVAEAAKHVQLNVSPVNHFMLADAVLDSVQVCDIDIKSDEPVEYLDYSLLLANGDKFETLHLGSTGNVATEDLVAAVNKLYGRRPSQRDIKATATVQVQARKVVFDKTADFTLSVTPNAPVIEEAYYVTGTCNGWDNTDVTYALTNGGGDVYDNPVFTCRIPASAVSGDLEFKLTPKSGVGGDWSACLCAGTEEGKFVDKNAGGNFFFAAVADAKFYDLSFDMLEMTYTINTISFGEYFYAIGGDTGWSNTYTLYGPANDGKYTGYGYLSEEFKFRPNADNWDNDLEFAGDGLLADIVGGPNCPAPAAGFYQINLDLTAGTYNLVQIEKVGVIGEFNGWNGDELLSYNKTENCWEGEVTFAEATKYKFRANGDWPINWGGDPKALTEGGADISAEAGTYNFKLYVSYNGASHVTITKK